jgi:L-threonylcarbamoyladenylate synthase
MTLRLATDPAGIAHAVRLLHAGALVAFATETVYGLGADATNAAAVAALYTAKGRPRFNPLICHYPSAEAAFADVAPTALAQRLAAAFWPGPLTLVLPRRTDCKVASLTGAGLDTLAVRVPAHPDALTLLAATGRPVAAPSANRSGGVSPTSAAHVLADLDGRIAAVLDSGPCPLGVESTVLDASGVAPVLLRPGGITQEALEPLTGPLARPLPAAGRPRAPGLSGSHYAPALPVRLGATSVTAEEALLAFGPPLAGAGATFQLSAGGDLAEAATRLFDGMRQLDAEGRRRGLVAIAAMAVPETGLGRAINDRLRRAAAPRRQEGGA